MLACKRMALAVARTVCTACSATQAEQGPNKLSLMHTPLARRQCCGGHKYQVLRKPRARTRAHSLPSLRFPLPLPSLSLLGKTVQKQLEAFAENIFLSAAKSGTVSLRQTLAELEAKRQAAKNQANSSSSSSSSSSSCPWSHSSAQGSRRLRCPMYWEITPRDFLTCAVPFWPIYSCAGCGCRKDATNSKFFVKFVF
jgi:hypothetical protein